MFELCQLMHDKDLPEANNCFWPIAAFPCCNLRSIAGARHSLSVQKYRNVTLINRLTAWKYRTLTH